MLVNGHVHVYIESFNVFFIALYVHNVNMNFASKKGKFLSLRQKYSLDASCIHRQQQQRSSREKQNRDAIHQYTIKFVV